MRARTLFVKFDTYFKWIMLTILLTRLAYNNSYYAVTPPPPPALPSPISTWWTVFTCRSTLCTLAQSRVYLYSIYASIWWLMCSLSVQSFVLQRKMFALIFFMVNRHIRTEPSPNRIYVLDCLQLIALLVRSYIIRRRVYQALAVSPTLPKNRMRMIVVFRFRCSFVFFTCQLAFNTHRRYWPHRPHI